MALLDRQKDLGVAQAMCSLALKGQENGSVTLSGFMFNTFIYRGFALLHPCLCSFRPSAFGYTRTYTGYVSTLYISN